MSKAIKVWISRDLKGPCDNDMMIWMSRPTLYETQWPDSKKYMSARIWHGVEEGECEEFELRRVGKGKK